MKNDNKIGETKVIRYANIECYSTFEQKKQVLNNCLRKVHEMANNDMRLKQSAMQKLAEFQKKGYPRRMLWTACTTIAVKTRNTTWFKVRKTI